MIRREFLAGLGALAWAGLTRLVVAQEPRLRVGVVGAGIVGASIAFHLARAGARVTQFEKAAPAAGATGKSFAWINAFVEDVRYQDLRIGSIAAWHELDEPLRLGVTWGGSLWWAQSPEDFAEIDAAAGQMARTSHPLRTLTARELADVSPYFQPKSLELAAYCDLDGHADPVRATRSFLDHAALAGASLLHPCEVTGLEFRNGRLTGVATSGGPHALDRLVVAAGIDGPRLLAQAGCRLPLRHAPGILAHSTPMKHLTAATHWTPNFLGFKQTAEGRLVAEDSELPPDTPAHHEIRERIVDYPDDAIRSLHGRRILEKVAAVLPASAEAGLERLTLGFRPIPEDGLPAIGPVAGAPDVYVAVMHSGVTLAPIVGRCVAQEVLQETALDSLAPFRPGRFAPGSEASPRAAA